MATRVLFVHNSGDLYGASRSLVRLLPRLAAAGTEVTVMMPEEGPLRRLLESVGVEVIVEPSIAIVTRGDWSPWGLVSLLLGLPRSASRIARVARERGIELIHTNTGVILSPALAARLAGIPHLWHIRDSFHEFNRVWPLYARYILSSSDRVVAVSFAIAAQFPKSDKVVVIHNGIAPEEFDGEHRRSGEEFRARFGLGDHLVVGCVGRIKLRRKGQEDLIAAAARLREQGIEAKYVVVGSPSPGSEQHLGLLRELAARFGLEHNVVFTGELDDPRPAYAAMDVFVLPSAQPEPFGGVVLEAMAMGLPVVATAIGGTTEQVVDGETGFLVPPADAIALADKLELLLRDPELRTAMGRRGRERVAEFFSLDVAVDRVRRVYRDVFAARGGRM